MTKTPNLLYLPALSMGDITDSTFAKGIMSRWGMSHNFLDKAKSVVYYPYFLMSAHYGRAEPQMRKDHKLHDCFIMGDSGGFQNVTLDANLDPLEILKWQEDNCTHGLILDHPPFEKVEGSAMFGRASDKTFKNSLEKTKQNAIIALTNRRKQLPFKLYGVIQGDTEQRKETWFKAMCDLEKEHGAFDGWALSPKPSFDIREIAQHAVIILTHKIDKPIHILQVTGFEGLALAAYISTKHPNLVTVDSSTFSYGRRFFIYNDPMTVTKKFHVGENKDVELVDNPCDCPVCMKFPWSAINETYEKGEKTIPGILLSLHNMYHTIRYTKYLNAIKNDPKVFRKFCQDNFGDKFTAVLDYIDEALISGHDKAWRKHIIKTRSLTEWNTAITEQPTEMLIETPTGEMETKHDIQKIADVVTQRIMDLKKEYPTVSDEMIVKLYTHQFNEVIQ